jgi:hypothetical protein
MMEMTSVELGHWRRHDKTSKYVQEVRGLKEEGGKFLEETKQGERNLLIRNTSESQEHTYPLDR